MSDLALDVRLDGFAAPVGRLIRDRRGDLGFVYTADHLAKSDALPLSLSLPLTDKPYGDEITRAFFDNLLQERDGALADVMAREGLSRSDVAGLLVHLGKDCPGALSVLPTGAPPAKVPGDFATDYAALTDNQLIAIVEALRDRRRPPEGTADPSPIAGLQSKIALTLLPDGRLAEPIHGSGAPTTHILKVPDRNHPRDASYEATTLEFSRALGFETAHASVLDVGGTAALLVRRFDRALDDDGRIVRLHQEDFAQALGLPATLKYERRGVPGRRFDVAGIAKILDATQSPAEERIRFIRATLFDLMTGNVDNHAKNLAVLHLAPSRLRVAPRYDLLPTRLDPLLTDEFSFRIGTASRLRDMTRSDFEAFLAILGIGTPAARRRIISANVTQIANWLCGTFDLLTQDGLKPFADLMASNIRQITSALQLSVPPAALNRDAFVHRGGGWLTS